MILKLEKAIIQNLKQCINQSWNKGNTIIWRQLHKMDESWFWNSREFRTELWTIEVEFENFELNFWILNSTPQIQTKSFQACPTSIIIGSPGIDQSLKRVQQAQDSRTLWFLKYFQLFLGNFEETTLSKFDSH